MTISVIVIMDSRLFFINIKQIMERKRIDMVTFRAAVASCPRKSGDHNGDNFYFNSKFITEELTSSQVMLAHKKSQNGIQMYAVTDGNMAEEYKDEISLMLVRGLKKYHARLIDDPDLYAVDVIDEYNREAYAAAKRRSLANEKRPFSSLGLMYINGESLAFSNTGNVRIYRIRDGVAEMFSVDHTQAQKMVELGLMTSDRAATHPQRKKLTQFFGVMPDEVSFRPVVFEEKAESGDVYVLCSSGCYENVSMARMAEISDESDTVADFVKTVFAEAASAGCREDITVLAVKAEDPNAVVMPIGDSHSHNVSAHSDDAAAAAAATGATAVVGTKKSGTASKPISNAEKKAQKSEKNSSSKKTSKNTANSVSVLASIKSFLGIGDSKDGENNEKIWPALLVFVVCLVLIIVLTVYGIKIYNSNKKSDPMTGYTPYGTVSTDTEASDTASSETELPTVENTATPDGTNATTAPAVTDNITNTAVPVTEVPATEAPVTEAPVTEAPVTEAPATEAPATEVPTTVVPTTATVAPTTATAAPTTATVAPTTATAVPTTATAVPTTATAAPTTATAAPTSTATAEPTSTETAALTPTETATPVPSATDETGIGGEGGGETVSE